MTRQYKIYASSVVSADNVASVRMVAKGMITAILFNVVGVAGAGADGYKQWEVSKQSANAILQNDTPPTVLANHTTFAPITSCSFGSSLLLAGIQQPVEAGDFIYLHNLQGGTAPATCRIWITLTVTD